MSNSTLHFHSFTLKVLIGSMEFQEHSIDDNRNTVIAKAIIVMTEAYHCIDL